MRCPRFEPATTGLSGKIHTHLTTAPSTWLQGSFYGIYTNGDDRWKGCQIRSWSSYVSWSLFCGRFVDIQSFCCIFRIREGNDFSQFGRTEVKETQGYATESLQIIYYFTHYADANQLSLADKSHVHTRIDQSVVFKIIFQDLIQWTEMFI